MCTLTVPTTLISGGVLLAVALISGAAGFVLAALLTGLLRRSEDAGWLGRLRDSHR